MSLPRLIIVDYTRYSDVYRRTGEISIVPVVSARTRQHERHAARVGVSRHTCGHRGIDYKPSFARTAAALIDDVHSPMDCSPVHARWEVIY